MALTRVYWRGARVDLRTFNMLEEVARITPTLPYIVPTQGGYNKGGVAASAGTHDGGGAVDLSVANLTMAQRLVLVDTLRRVGFAAWLRTPAQGFIWHVHAIAINCSEASVGARSQVVQYLRGQNGLANRGRDDGPGDWRTTTWETYKPPPASNSSDKDAPPAQPPPPPQEEDMTFIVYTPGQTGLVVVGDKTIGVQMVDAAAYKAAGIKTITLSAKGFAPYLKLERLG